MRKIISLFLCLCLLLSLSSCGEENREYDRDTVLSEAERLIKKTEKLNVILWGEGLSYIEDLNYSDGIYYMANPIDTKEYGIETLDDLIFMMKETFSVGYCAIVNETVFTGLKGDTGVNSYSRYYQKYSALDLDEPECIMVNSQYYFPFYSEIEYMYDTLYDIGSEGEVIYVGIKAKVSKDGKSQIKDLKIGLIEESDGFKVETHTFANYYEELSED
jgi:hypothetical protein